MLTLGTLNGAHDCVLTSTSDDQGAICLLPYCKKCCYSKYIVITDTKTA